MSAINFSNDFSETLNGFIQSLDNVNSNSNSNISTEFEIRFGKFNYEKNTNKYYFDTNSNVTTFYRIKNAFKKQNFKYNIINTLETIYENKNGMRGSLKKIFDKNTNFTSYMLKNTFKKYDVYDYDLRLSLASEKKINKTYLEKLDIDYNKYLIREKNRCSFVLPIGTLDLTIVKENTNEKYEIELEIKKGADFNQVLQFITLILQISQQNYFITSKNEKKQILNEYKQMTNSYFFIGAQPETLHKNQISDLYKEEYSVTDKADGDRTFLFIDRNGMIYFIDNNLDIFNKTNIQSSQYKSCLIDGEKIVIGNETLFMAFDLLVLNGQDIRGNMNYLLKTRLEHTQSIIKNIQYESNNSNLYKFETKEFIFKNVFIGCEIILNTIKSKPYKNDGLIFTPINEPYPITKKWSKLLKWKQPDQNTIDFYAIKTENEEWELYVQDAIDEYKKEVNTQNTKNIQKNNLILFDIDQICPNTKTSDLITFKTSFDDNLLDPTTDEPFKSNTVIEFYWNFQMRKFMPLRTRWDKTNNKKKHGNFKSVACSIWNNIHNPIDTDFLFKFSTPGNKDDVFFSRMRKYHNKVKEQLYNTYTKKSNSLLELCSGRGGDMHKWVFNDIKNVIGYDISDKNISECVKRVSQLKENTKTNLNFQFHKLDLGQEDAYKIIYEKTSYQFDNAFCNFGIHYFFESKKSFESILNILNQSLKENGYFVVTFIDNQELYNLLKNRNTYYRIDETTKEISYYLCNNSEKKNDLYGNKLKIILNGNNILGEGSDEYIINYNEFCNLMNQNNFKLVESQLFKDIYANYNNFNLTQIEQDISFLNRYCVFQKVSNNENINIQSFNVQSSKIQHKNINDPIIREELGFNNIILHHNDFSAVKISSGYDILNVLNCIEYKYYKNKYNNKNINSYDDIQCIFKEYDINYNSVFVENLYKFSLENNSYMKNIYFTNCKNIIEKKEKETNKVEIQEETVWYILFYKNKICFDWPQQQEQQQQEQQQPQEQEQQQEQQQPNKKNEIKQKVLEMKEKNEKFTIKNIKPYLEELNLKTTGKKDELLNRLFEYLEIN